MAFDKIPRPSSGSGKVEIIDGIEFPGLGSGGFGPNDFLFIGSDGDDFDLIGGTGHDELEGEAGNDKLLGGDGNDRVEGDDGEDDLDGQDGTDILEGGAGNDILRAGYGHDELTGGTGDDTFGFYALGHFHVKDFSIGEDQLFFDAEKIGVNDLSELVGYITNIDQRSDGVTVEFGPNASIELVGVNLADISADMVVFHL
ncbi:Hemolysin-type calcium-binding region [Nitrosomonas sp. Is79A3]|uniref:hemolysin expression modulating protein n=1 Tax=Nitrosomonas sp. (strain Is79A3) TaxID=261292 RepID=UPI000215CDD6